MTETRPEEIVKLLNADLAGEHQAILQYLQHAWNISDEGLRCTLEGIARDEMRHFEWLAEHIVEYGGVPTLEHGPVQVEGSLPELLTQDREGEAAALAQYRVHMAAVGGGKVVALWERIASDEEVHHAKLTALLAALPAPAAADAAESGTAVAALAPGDAERLERGVRHEYTVILDYLLHAFIGGDAAAKHQLIDMAIEEMKHLGWLAESVAEAGGRPEVTLAEPLKATGLTEMLRRGLSTEQDIRTQYEADAAAAGSAQLKALFQRLAGHEAYHDRRFAELLAHVEEQRRGRSFTVGSLKPKK